MNDLNEGDYSFMSSPAARPQRTNDVTRGDAYAAAIRDCQDPTQLARISKEFLQDNGVIGQDRSGEVTVLPPKVLLRRAVTKGQQTRIITAESVAELDRQTQAFLFGGR